MEGRDMQNLERDENPLESRRPRVAHWKPALAAVGGVLALALLIGLATGAVQEVVDVAAGPQFAATDEPPPQVIEACNSYAARADTAVIVQEGLRSGAITPDEGAGGDETAGTLFGLSEENRRNEAARIAYGDCMERRGY